MGLWSAQNSYGQVWISPRKNMWACFFHWKPEKSQWNKSTVGAFFVVNISYYIYIRPPTLKAYIWERWSINQLFPCFGKLDEIAALLRRSIYLSIIFDQKKTLEKISLKIALCSKVQCCCCLLPFYYNLGTHSLHWYELKVIDCAIIIFENVENPKVMFFSA